MHQILNCTNATHLHGGADEVIGYIASALVLAAFSMKSMRLLRTTAIASNVVFIAYALAANMHPILVLHSILLPVNVCRLAQTRLAVGCESNQSRSWLTRWSFRLRKAV